MRLIFLVALLGVCLPCSDAQSRDTPPSEYDLKATFLSKFARFVTWPEVALADSVVPMRIGILGDDPFGDAFDPVIGGGNNVAIRYYDAVEDVDCHVLFVSASERRNLKQILTNLKQRSILTVGDVKGFADEGGMINFIVVGNKVRFEINNQAAEQAGLKISARLLKLARRITTTH